jgi:hypothetical protein
VRVRSLVRLSYTLLESWRAGEEERGKEMENNRIVFYGELRGCESIPNLDRKKSKEKGEWMVNLSVDNHLLKEQG